ncbi:Crp/Fnr family transcriptional regulator [Sphingobacterium sp. 40-24]|uniref:Crp/Fnr family transcriptional regulator n=1 Tax=Sphingobacterium sp. 40-24 TaxID=1895843 RepID=UPI000968B752|nr:Crp/Fnr family transcriptional regulator [Sphingobacterium sp. 40-24]OJZ00091.1 MAG: cyclic nucleotide-binding protein [Sphingobacterium sp. 40-24]
MQKYSQSATDLIVKLFESIHPLSDDLKQLIETHSYVIDVKAGVRLIDIGQVQKQIYFILQGGVHSYYIDPAGNKISSWLLYEGELAIAVYSFFSQKPSFEAIETLEPCSLLVLSYEKLNELYHQFPEFNFIGRVLTERYYIKSEEKANELRMLPAVDRYRNLVERYPEILKRTPLGIVASYLGITRSTLSRIRAKV